MPVLSLACHLLHNAPHIPWRYNYEQTTKQTKAINNSYIYIYINISCKCDTNRAGHLTLDAYASRPVACVVMFLQLIWRQCSPLKSRNMTIGESALEFIKNYAKLNQKYGNSMESFFVMHIFLAVDCKCKQLLDINGIKLQINNFSRYNRSMSPMRMLPEACRELEGDYNRLAEVLIRFSA